MGGGGGGGAGGHPSLTGTELAWGVFPKITEGGGRREGEKRETPKFFLVIEIQTPSICWGGSREIWLGCRKKPPHHPTPHLPTHPQGPEELLCRFAC